MSLIFVLVGPFADSKRLAAWAHSEFRKDAAVAFIGVDRGLDSLVDSGLPVTFAIGDMDGGGRKMKLPPEIPVVRLPREKERSDLAFALEFCAGRKARMIYAFGFQGGRADHDFGVHLDLSAVSRRVPRVVSLGEKGATFYLDARFAPLKLSRRAITELRQVLAPKARRSKADSATKLASLFPIGAKATGVRLRGLRFPALDGILSLSSQGLSNEIRAANIEVGVRRGRLALFFPV
jgi:thiamine pyrophosphokinase